MQRFVVFCLIGVLAGAAAAAAAESRSEGSAAVKPSVAKWPVSRAQAPSASMVASRPAAVDAAAPKANIASAPRVPTAAAGSATTRNAQAVRNARSADMPALLARRATLTAAARAGAPAVRTPTPGSAANLAAPALRAAAAPAQNLAAPAAMRLAAANPNMTPPAQAPSSALAGSPKLNAASTPAASQTAADIGPRQSFRVAARSQQVLRIPSQQKAAIGPRAASSVPKAPPIAAGRRMASALAPATAHLGAPPPAPKTKEHKRYNR
jgi:hypothetical protein